MRLSLVVAAALALITGTAHAATLDDVKARGHLLCGVNPGLQGFAAPDAQGQWAGFDVDFCKAVAAAVLGDSIRREKAQRGFSETSVTSPLMPSISTSMRCP